MSRTTGFATTTFGGGGAGGSALWHPPASASVVHPARTRRRRWVMRAPGGWRTGSRYTTNASIRKARRRSSGVEAPVDREAGARHVARDRAREVGDQAGDLVGRAVALDR